MMAEKSQSETTLLERGRELAKPCLAALGNKVEEQGQDSSEK